MVFCEAKTRLLEYSLAYYGVRGSLDAQGIGDAVPHRNERRPIFPILLYKLFAGSSELSQAATASMAASSSVCATPCMIIVLLVSAGWPAR